MFSITKHGLCVSLKRIIGRVKSFELEHCRCVVLGDSIQMISVDFSKKVPNKVLQRPQFYHQFYSLIQIFLPNFHLLQTAVLLNSSSGFISRLLSRLFSLRYNQFVLQTIERKWNFPQSLSISINFIKSTKFVRI